MTALSSADEHSKPADKPPTQQESKKPAADDSKKVDPLTGLRITGSVFGDRTYLYLFSVSPNGEEVPFYPQDYGYRIIKRSECEAVLVHADTRINVTCSPRI